MKGVHDVVLTDSF